MFFFSTVVAINQWKGSKTRLQLPHLRSWWAPLCSWEGLQRFKCTGLLLKTPRLLCCSWSISGQVAKSTEGLESNLSIYRGSCTCSKSFKCLLKLQIPSIFFLATLKCHTRDQKPLGCDQSTLNQHWFSIAGSKLASHWNDWRFANASHDHLFGVGGLGQTSHGATVDDGVLDLTLVGATLDLEVTMVTPVFIPAVGHQPVRGSILSTPAHDLNGMASQHGVLEE